MAINGPPPGSQELAVMQSQLRSSFAILGTAVMGDPEVYITFKPEMVDADGAIANEGTAKFLKGFLDTFDAWIDRVG